MGRVVARTATGLDGDLTWAHEDEGLGIWDVEPDVPRTASGVKDRVSRLKALGNAVVPQIVELLGYAILNADRESREKGAA